MRRPRWWLAAVMVVLLVGAAALTWGFVGGDEPTVFEAEVGSAPPLVAQPGAAAQTLQRLEDAIRDGDVAAASSLAGDAPGADALVGSLASNAVAARITDVSFRYIDETGAVGVDGAWPAAVAVEWRYARFDDAPARTEMVIRFTASSAEEAFVVGIGDATLRTPVWMAGPLEVTRTEDLLVLVADASERDRYTALATRAMGVVSRVLPDWDGRLVVEVPPSAAALERALGVEPGFYQQIAAVTGSPDGSTADDAPIHVFVNPEVFEGLGRRGQEVVLDHETAHVAGDGPTSLAPTWLVEGFADYVALRDSDLPLSTTAAQIREQVEQEGVPTRLPDAADFDTRGPHLGAVYESAWLACTVLAARGGDDAFLRFYSAVSVGEDDGVALRRLFGWTRQELTAAWQLRLESIQA